MQVNLCHDLDWSKVSYPSCVSPKIDGIRAVYEPGCSYLISRNQKPIWGMDHIIKDLNRQPHIVDMELTVPGMGFNELSGLIRNHSVTPNARAHVIDIPDVAGFITERLTRRPFESEHVRHIPHYKVLCRKDIDRYYEKFILEGYEGLVWKSFNHVYRGHRSWHWLRLVPTKTYDVEVIKLYEGAGKLAKMCGGFYFKLNGLLCKCGTMKDITHEERAYMWVYQDQYVGRTAEIEIKEFQPSGMPRQPRFKRWRDDK